jgi:hypothetical protein
VTVCPAASACRTTWPPTPPVAPKTVSVMHPPPLGPPDIIPY